MVRVITFGTFDLLHIGHLNILERAHQLGNYMIVGISSDNFNKKKKDRFPIVSQEDRMRIVKSLRYVDEVFLEESFEKKEEYISKYNADILVMGDDWLGHFDEFKKNCKVVYLSRTKDISTTEIIAGIINEFSAPQTN